MTRSFAAKPDLTLEAKLQGELSGIFLWAREGWIRLRDRKHFIQPESASADVEDMKYGNNPIQSFVHSSGCCVLGAEHKVSRTAFRDRLSRWWNVSGLNGMCPSAEDVGKTLRAIVPGLKDGKVYEGSARVNGYQGI